MNCSSMTAIAFCFAAQLLVPAAGKAQDTPSRAATPPAPLAKEAWIHRFLLTPQNPELLAAQVLTANMRHRGLSHDRIVQQLTAKRTSWRRLSQPAPAAQVSESGGAMTVPNGPSVTRALGEIASQLLLAENGDGVPAALSTRLTDLGIGYYEASLAGERVSRTAQRLAEDFSGDSLWDPATLVFELVHDTYERDADFQRAWNALFLPEYGFAPTAPDHTVLADYPAFANHALMRTVAESTRDSGTQRQRLIDAVDTVHLDVLRRISTGIDQIVADTQRRQWREAELRLQRQLAQRQQAEVAAMRSVTAFASTLIGFRDPALARQIRAMSDATFRFDAALRAYRVAQQSGANMTLATLALSGNVVGTVLGFFGALNSGPDPDVILLRSMRQLGEHLSQQVHRVRTEIHGGFEGVHRHLNGMYNVMQRGFRLLAENNLIMLGNIKESLEAFRDELAVIQGRQRNISLAQLDLGHLMWRQSVLLRETTEGLHLAPCLRPHSAAAGDPMTLTKFRDCRAKIETMGRQLAGAQVGDVFRTPAALTDWLNESPEATFSRSFREFATFFYAVEHRTQAPTDAPLPASVVGPEAWFHAVDIHDRFVGTYPEHEANERAAIDSDFVLTMNRERNRLIRYLRAIESEILTFQRDPTQPTAFSEFFESLFRKSDEVLSALFIEAMSDYFGVNEETLRTVRWRVLDNGAIRPLFGPWPNVDGVNIPMWVQLQGADCVQRGDRRPVGGGLLRDYFVGYGLLDYISDTNMDIVRLAAHLGGRIRVCVRGQANESDVIHVRRNGDRVANRDVRLDIEIQYSGSLGGRRVSCDLAAVPVSSTWSGRNGGSFGWSETLRATMPEIRRHARLQSSPNGGCSGIRRDYFGDSLLRYIVGHMLTAAEFENLEQTVSVADGHLRSWLRFALREMGFVGVDVVGMDVVGVTVGPIGRKLKNVRDFGSFFGLLASMDGMMREEIEALRSARLKDAFGYGYGGGVLTGVRFDNLDATGVGEAHITTR